MRPLLSALVLAALGLPPRAPALDSPVHGLWVWKSKTVLEAPRGVRALQEFCKSAAITEVYMSFPSHTDPGEEARFAALISTLHDFGIRIEALVTSLDADEPGAPRDKLLAHVRSVLQFNDRHPGGRFDGIHLDIEPQQRAENKGAGNLDFLGGLTEAYRDVAALTGPARLTLNADVQIKLLKGDLPQRRALLTAIPRLTLMLYELASPDDGTTAEQKERMLREYDEAILQAAYRGLDGEGVAKMAIALRTRDYGPLLPRMLKSLDDVNQANPHYLGWARHSYNDLTAP